LQALDLNANRRPQTAQTFSRMLDGGQDSGSAGSRSPGPDKTEQRQADSSLSPKGCIKLPSIDLHAAGIKKPASGEEAGKHKNWILPIALIPALLAVGGGAYYFWPEMSNPQPPIKNESASIEKIEKTGEEKRSLQQGADEKTAKKDSTPKGEQINLSNTASDANPQPPMATAPAAASTSALEILEQRRLRQEAAEPATPTPSEEPPAPTPVIKKDARKREDQSKQRTAQRDNKPSQRRRSQKSEPSSQAEKSESQGAGSWGPMVNQRSYKTD